MNLLGLFCIKLVWLLALAKFLKENISILIMNTSNTFAS